MKVGVQAPPSHNVQREVHHLKEGPLTGRLLNKAGLKDPDFKLDSVRDL